MLTFKKMDYMFMIQFVIGIINFTANKIPKYCTDLGVGYWVITHYLQSFPAIFICLFFFHKGKTTSESKRNKMLKKHKVVESLEEQNAFDMDQE